MKKLLVLYFIITFTLVAQNVSIIENIAVTNENDGKFFYPTISPDGNKLLFSSESKKGIWIKNLQNGEIIKITEASGAGYDAGFSDNGNEVIFRDDKFISGRRVTSLYAFDLLKNEKTMIENEVRDLKISRTNQWKCYIYLKENLINTIPNKSVLNKDHKNNVSVFIENSKITLYDNGVKKILLPLGEGNYIWPSISPDNSKLLFTLAGKGTFISDLEGNIISELGRANYPSWSPDGNWIVFMDDYDDGKVLISSNIGIIKSDGSAKKILTNDNKNIHIYPKWSNEINEIYYNTQSGQIKKLTLKFE